MSRFATAVLAMALVTSPAGCGPLPGVAPKLDGTGWRATLVAGRQPLPGSEPTARFDGGRISGSTGCNRYGGLARVEDGSLTVTEIVVPLAGTCDEPAASSQKLFIDALVGSRSLRFEGGNLVIDGSSGEIVFRRDDTVR